MCASRCISLIPASQLAMLSLVFSCSSHPSSLVSQIVAEAFALLSGAAGLAHESLLPFSCLCSTVQHLCYGRALLASEIFFCSPSRLIIPTSFPSLPIFLPSSPQCILFTSDYVSHLPRIKQLAWLLSTCCTGSSQANDKHHKNTLMPGKQIHY